MIDERLADVAFPARDQSLARVIAELSGPDAGRPADNLITNEDSFARVAGDLRRLAPAGGVYLGVGPDQNLTYIAHARPRLSFILDFRRRNALLHFLHKALFSLAADRAGYLSRLIARRPSSNPTNPSASALVATFDGVAMDRPFLEATVASARDVLRPLGLIADADSEGRFLPTTIYARTGARSGPLYVHAKVGIVDDRWMTIGSANLNAHSLFNDSEVNVITDDAELARRTRVRLWAEHLERPEEEVAGDPTQVIDELWRPTAEEQLARRRADRVLTHRLMRLEPSSKRSQRLLGPLQGLLVDG